MSRARNRTAYMREYHFKRKEAMALKALADGAAPQRIYAPRAWCEETLTEPWSVFHARKKAEREAAKRETNGAVDRGTD